jgi:hypothetical protein
MTMNPTPRKLSQQEQDLVAEYLKNGGTVTKGKDSTYSSELGISNNQWGQRRPKQKKQEGGEE